MNPVSVDIKDILETEGHGTFGTDLFIGREPSAPANCVTIYDTGGGAQNDRLALDDATIQIRARNSGYENGYGKLEAIKLALEARPSAEVNGTNYVGFWASTNIAFMKYDDNDRAIFTANFRVTREPDEDETGHRTLIEGD